MSTILDHEFRNYNLTRTRSTGIKWGAILGGASVVFSLVMFLTDQVSLDNSFSNWQTWVNYALMITGVVMCQREFRDTVNAGYMSIYQGLKLGVWMGLISGVIVGIYMAVYGTVLDPDFKSKIIDAAIAQAEARGQNAEQVEESMKMMEWMFEPTFFSIMMVIGSVFWLAIMGLIVSLFLRKDAPAEKF